MSQKNAGKFKKFFLNWISSKYCPGTFSNRSPSNLRILIKLALLVLDMLRWNSVLLFFREEDSGDLSFSIKVTFDFFEFFLQLKFFTSALIFQHFFQVLTQLFACNDV